MKKNSFLFFHTMCVVVCISATLCQGILNSEEESNSQDERQDLIADRDERKGVVERYRQAEKSERGATHPGSRKQTQLPSTTAPPPQAHPTPPHQPAPQAQEQKIESRQRNEYPQKRDQKEKFDRRGGKESITNEQRVVSQKRKYDYERRNRWEERRRWRNREPYYQYYVPYWPYSEPYYGGYDYYDYGTAYPLGTPLPQGAMAEGGAIEVHFVSTKRLTVTPGQVISTTVAITNHTNWELNISLVLHFPPGWHGDPEMPQLIHFAPNETQKKNVQINVPPGIPSGQYSISCEAFSEEYPDYGDEEDFGLLVE